MLNIFPQTLCSGDNIPLKLKFTDPNTGAAISMVGSTLGLTVKTDPLGADLDDSKAIFIQDIVGDVTGIFNFLFGPLSAGNYWLDVKQWNTAATPVTKTTVIPSFQFKIIQSTTARTAP